MFKKKLILALLLIPLWLGCNEEPTTPNTNGEITGVIRDFETNNLIANAIISTIPATSTSKSDSHGRFTLKNLQPRTYKLVVSKEEYIPNITSATVITIQSTQANALLKKTTNDCGIVTGFLFSINNLLPLKDVEVTLTPQPENWSILKTDSSGFYQISLPVGVYEISYIKEFFKKSVYQIEVKKNEILNLDNGMIDGTPEPTDSNTFVYYSFNSRLKNGLIEDNSRNNYHAEMVNNCQYADGKFGKCIKISSGYGKLGGWIKMDFPFYSGEFTVNMWVKEITDQYVVDKAYFQIGDNTTGVCHIGRNNKWQGVPTIGDGRNYYFAVGSENIYNPKNTPLVVDDTDYKYDDWNMFTLIYNEGKIFAYINSVLVGSKEQYYKVLNPEYFGMGMQWNSKKLLSCFSAYFDEFRIYKYPLNEEQIQNLYTKNSLN